MRKNYDGTTVFPFVETKHRQISTMRVLRFKKLKILCHHWNGRKLRVTRSTWEPLENLAGASDILKRYREQHGQETPSRKKKSQKNMSERKPSEAVSQSCQTIFQNKDDDINGTAKIITWIGLLESFKGRMLGTCD